MKYYGVILLLVVLLAACSQNNPVDNAEFSAQAGSWQKLGGALDYTVAKSAINPRLLLDKNGSLVVAWTEDNNGQKVYLERWTSTGWQTLGKVFPIQSSYREYSIVFDRSNNPVISSYVNDVNPEVAIYRFDNSSKTWKQLGETFKGSPSIAADSKGFIYSVLYDNLRFNFYESGPVDEGLGKGKNIIRRWSGSSWQNVRVYKGVVISSRVGYDVAVTSLSFKSDGVTPVVNVNVGEFSSALKGWTGTTWQILCDIPRNGSARLDRKDQCFGYNGEQNLYQGKQLLNDPSIWEPSATFDLSNRPIAGINYGEDIFVKRWSGSAWVQLGGIVDRIATRNVNIYSTSLLADRNNTLYAGWSECVDYDAVNSRCNNWNVYVSKYVP